MTRARWIGAGVFTLFLTMFLDVIVHSQQLRPLAPAPTPLPTFRALATRVNPFLQRAQATPPPVKSRDNQAVQLTGIMPIDGGQTLATFQIAGDDVVVGVGDTLPHTALRVTRIASDRSVWRVSLSDHEVLNWALPVDNGPMIQTIDPASQSSMLAIPQHTPMPSGDIPTPLPIGAQ